MNRKKIFNFLLILAAVVSCSYGSFVRAEHKDVASYIVFEAVSQQAADVRAKKFIQFMNNAGWMKIAGKVYERSPENLDGSYAERKKNLFDALIQGNDFLWLEELSSKDDLPSFEDRLSVCKEYIDEGIPAGDRTTRSVKWPHFVYRGPATLKLFSLEKSKQSLGDKLVLLSLGGLSNKILTDIQTGSPIRIGDPGVLYSAYYLDLKKCSYRFLSSLGTGRFGGYQDSLPRLYGVGLYKDNFAVYSLYNSGNSQRLTGDLKFFSRDGVHIDSDDLKFNFVAE